MNKAINRDELLKVLYKGRAKPMYVHGFYPDLAGWDPTWEKRFPEMYGYDVKSPSACSLKLGTPTASRRKPGCSPCRGTGTHPADGGGADPVARGGHRAGAGRPTGWQSPANPGIGAHGYLYVIPPSKKAVEPQIAAFNAGKALVHQFETDEIYQMWQELVQLTDPAARRKRSYARSATISSRISRSCPLRCGHRGGRGPKVIDGWAFSGGMAATSVTRG